MFLVVQWLVENNFYIRGLTSGIRFVPPRAVLNHKSIACGAESPLGICEMLLLEILLHGDCIIKMKKEP